MPFSVTVTTWPSSASVVPEIVWSVPASAALTTPSPAMGVVITTTGGVASTVIVVVEVASGSPATGAPVSSTSCALTATSKLPSPAGNSPALKFTV